MSSYVFQCVGLTGGTTDNLDAMDPSAFTGKEIAITITDPTTDQRKYYMHQAVNSGATADGINIIAPVVTSTWRWHILPRPLSEGILIVEDQKALGTNGGDSIAGVNTRALNTVVYNGITGASLATNQPTLPAGTFLIRADAPCYSGNMHQVYLYNVTDSAEVKRGTSEYNYFSSIVQTRSHVETVVTYTVATTLELRHYITNAKTVNGLGYNLGQGIEVYSRFTVKQLA